MIKLIYRISEVGYNKIKPYYVNNENCLKNATVAFPLEIVDWHVIADGVGEETKKMIESYIPPDKIDYINIKKGSGYPFMYSVDKFIKTLDDDTIIYFVENDYIHRPNSYIILQEGFELGADYVTLYDHPDKYINAKDGGNPYIEDNGEITRVYLSKSCHWKLTNSTTATFAAKIRTLKEDYQTIVKFANQPYLNDFAMFTELIQVFNRTLISPLPGYSTHGETKWLTPLIDWEQIILNSIKEK